MRRMATMRKRIISFLLAVSFCILLQTPAMAYETTIPNDRENEIQTLLKSVNIEEELRYAEMGYIDPSVDQTVLDSVEVGTTDPNGEVSYSVRRLGTVGEVSSLNSNSNEEGVMYVVSATKVTRNDTSGFGMEAHLIMGWIDNFGPSNELVYVSGSWITGNYTITGRLVDFGVAGAHDEYIENEAYQPTRNTFYYTPQNKMCGLKLLAYSTIVSEESNAVDDALYCRVCPTIFD